MFRNQAKIRRDVLRTGPTLECYTHPLFIYTHYKYESISVLVARWRHNDGDKRCAAERGRLASRAFLRRSGADETRTTREQRLQASERPGIGASASEPIPHRWAAKPDCSRPQKDRGFGGAARAHAGAQQEKTM